MEYRTTYLSPMGELLLTADEIGLTGLWFQKEKYIPPEIETLEEEEIPVFEETRAWLDIYFSGKEPEGMPSIHMVGTEFQCSVWEILRQIPYGKTTTYGEIAKQIAKQRGLSRMSAQAVGGAVGRNKISILLPCHRVVGTSGSLTGYAGGIDKKIRLLQYEGVSMEKFFVPKKSTAP